MGSDDGRTPAREEHTTAERKQRKMAQAKRKQAAANTSAWLAALAVLAVVSFWALASAVAARETSDRQLVRVPYREAAGALAASDSAIPANASAVLRLAGGVRESARSAVRALGSGDATAAAVATDAAMRGAEVGRHASSGPARVAFDSTLALVRDARHARQNGDPTRAAMLLDRAAGAMDIATAAGIAGGAPTELDAYEGVRLIDVRGSRIGVVDHVVASSSGVPTSADLVIGGWHHVLGFLDFGGEHVTVPANVLLFGEPAPLGPVHVVVTTRP